jgi:hypothetical protein
MVVNMKLLRDTTFLRLQLLTQSRRAGPIRLLLTYAGQRLMKQNLIAEILDLLVRTI